MQAAPLQPQESALAPPILKITRGHSCILCQQRKVRCDRQKPCSNCLKAGAECIPSPPSLPRRKRRKLTESDLVGRLRRYEHLLRKHNIKIEDDEEGLEDAAVNHELGQPEAGRKTSIPRRAARGALFQDKENTRYVENNLWEHLRDWITDPKDALQTSSDDELDDASTYTSAEALLVGCSPGTLDLSSAHPPFVQIFRLWQTFLQNVNPLVKMFHAPTVQQALLDASEDLAHTPRHMEALMFAIYFLAVTSLKNEDCEIMFGESRGILLRRYSHSTLQALGNAKFLKSLNIFTLQALILYLLGAREIYDPHSLWVLSGCTVRIAQRLGLHRDGTNDKLSPFDAEIRRRTWWQVVFLDGSSSKLAGTGFPGWLAKFDTKVPMNVGDSDLSPGMKDPPTEKEGATEMMFCCLRYETAQALHAMHGGRRPMAGPRPVKSLGEKDKAINELEIRFKHRFIQYCDASIPLHLIVMCVARIVICTLRLMAHHPRQYPDKGASMSQDEKDMLFMESLKVLEFDSLGFTTKIAQGYLWHIAGSFQLDAFIYLVSELRTRTSGELSDRAWHQTEVTLEFRAEILEPKNSLYFAMGNLIVKAWDKREEAADKPLPIPPFISLLRSQRAIHKPPPLVTPPQPEIPSPRPILEMDFQNLGQQSLAYNNDHEIWRPEDFDANIPEITPADWEYWQSLMDGDLPAYGNSGNFPGYQGF